MPMLGSVVKADEDGCDFVFWPAKKGGDEQCVGFVGTQEGAGKDIPVGEWATQRAHMVMVGDAYHKGYMGGGGYSAEHLFIGVAIV